MDWCPHVTVATVVERDGRYLLVEEYSNGKLVINQPAGHLEAHETLIDAAKRETLEETGWHVTPTAILGVSLYTSPNNSITYHRTTFIADAESEISDATLDEGIVRALWMTYEEVVEAKARLRSPLVLATIELYQSGQSFPLDIIYQAE